MVVSLQAAMSHSQRLGSSSWLATECGSLAHCCHLHHKKQIVPAISANVKSVLPPVQQCAQQSSRQQLHVTSAASSAVPALEVEDATEARLYMLYDFVKHHGRLPELHEQHKHVAVGKWSEQCRIQHHEQQLDLALIEALETLPGWNWQLKSTHIATEVKQTIQLLQQYCQKHGRMPSKRMRSDHKYRGGPDGPVATAAFLRMHDLRKRGLLSTQQMQQLETSLPDWKWDVRVRAPALDQLLDILQDFSKKHGRLPKPHEKLPDGFLIGEWCSLQRSEYTKGDIPLDVADAIVTAIPGWVWNIRDGAFWDGLEVLKRYEAVHRRMPSQREQFEGVRVGAWANKQRLRYRQATMPPDRTAALEAIDGWWWSSEDMPVE